MNRRKFLQTVAGAVGASAFPAPLMALAADEAVLAPDQYRIPLTETDFDEWITADEHYGYNGKHLVTLFKHDNEVIPFWAEYEESKNGGGGHIPCIRCTYPIQISHFALSYPHAAERLPELFELSQSIATQIAKL